VVTPANFITWKAAAFVVDDPDVREDPAWMVPLVGVPGLSLRDTMLVNMKAGNHALLFGHQFYDLEYQEDHPGSTLGPQRQVVKVRDALCCEGVVHYVKGHKGTKEHPGKPSILWPGEGFTQACQDLPAIPWNAWTHPLKRDHESESPPLALANDFLGAIQFRTDHKAGHHGEHCPRLYAGNGQLIVRRGSPDKAGRLFGYGPACPQFLPSKFRPYLSMHLDGVDHSQLVSLDVKAQAMRRLYALEGLDYGAGDPYMDLSNALGINRAQAKHLTQVIINNRSEGMARNSLRVALMDEGLSLDPKHILAVFRGLFSPIWKHCMTMTSHVLHPGDGDWMLSVIGKCAQASIPLLPLHDGIIVPQAMQVDAQAIMEETMGEHFSQVFPLGVDPI